MTRKMLRYIGIWLAIILIASLAVTRFISQERTQESTFATSPMGVARPTDLGIDFETVNITKHQRELMAWHIPAESATGAVLVFHGQRESLSDWIYAIERLHNANLSIFVFDYSGFGESEGAPSINTLREDAIAAYEEFELRSNGLPTYLLGYSLGAGVLLDALNHHEMPSDGIVLASPFSSIPDIAVDEGVVPDALSFLIPDIYDNVSHVQSIKRPVRVVHSETDGLFPIWMAEKIAASAQNAKLSIVGTPAHAEFLASNNQIGDAGDEFWAAVLRAMGS